MKAIITFFRIAPSTPPKACTYAALTVFDAISGPPLRSKALLPEVEGDTTRVRVLLYLVRQGQRAHLRKRKVQIRNRVAATESSGKLGRFDGKYGKYFLLGSELYCFRAWQIVNSHFVYR